MPPSRLSAGSAPLEISTHPKPKPASRHLPHSLPKIPSEFCNSNAKTLCVYNMWDQSPLGFTVVNSRVRRVLYTIMSAPVVPDSPSAENASLSKAAFDRSQAGSTPLLPRRETAHPPPGRYLHRERTGRRHPAPRRHLLFHSQRLPKTAARTARRSTLPASASEGAQRASSTTAMRSAARGASPAAVRRSRTRCSTTASE